MRIIDGRQGDGPFTAMTQHWRHTLTFCLRFGRPAESCYAKDGVVCAVGSANNASGSSMGTKSANKAALGAKWLDKNADNAGEAVGRLRRHSSPTSTKPLHIRFHPLWRVEHPPASQPDRNGVDSTPILNSQVHRPALSALEIRSEHPDSPLFALYGYLEGRNALFAFSSAQTTPSSAQAKHLTFAKRRQRHRWPANPSPL